MRLLCQTVAESAKERKHEYKGNEVGAEKSAVKRVPSSATILTSCRSSDRTTPGSDKVMLVYVKAGNGLSFA
jgi:hypothetical protein